MTLQDSARSTEVAQSFRGDLSRAERAVRRRWRGAQQVLLEAPVGTYLVGVCLGTGIATLALRVVAAVAHL